MIMLMLLSNFLLPFCAGTVVTGPEPRFLYDVELEFEPAFCSILENKEKSVITGKKAYDLGVSTFTGNTNSKDKVFSFNDIQQFNSVKNFTLDQLNDELVWPNEVEQVPDGIFDNRVWSVASAFFLPGKNNGTIALIDMTDKKNPETVFIVPQEEKLWFYHRVLWEDMNHDGHLDAVTARAYGTGAAAIEAQLIWLENPGYKYLTASWNVHVVHEGVEDIAFVIHKLPLEDGTLTPVVISAGFWSFELGITWSDTNNWMDLTSIQHRAFDKYGWYFDLQIADMNMDGISDILCTTWSQLGDPGALLGYEIPNDWKNADWTRHVIQDGYTEFPFPGLGSPGSPASFWPEVSMKENGNKPWIVLTGDDNGEAYIITPDSEDKSNWSYTSTTIYSQSGNTVGKIAVGDVDEDGFAEVFLPSYDKKILRVMTYRP